jgi:hypothetical protein
MVAADGFSKNKMLLRMDVMEAGAKGAKCEAPSEKIRE